MFQIRYLIIWVLFTVAGASLIINPITTSLFLTEQSSPYVGAFMITAVFFGAVYHTTDSLRNS